MNFNKKIYAFFYSLEFPNLPEEPMLVFRSILEKRETFDPTAIFVAIKIDVLRENERQTYFNFYAPTRLRMYKNGNCVIDNYTIATNFNQINEPELWSLYYVQIQLARLLNETTNMQTQLAQTSNQITALTKNPGQKNRLIIRSNICLLFFQLQLTMFICSIPTCQNPKLCGFQLNGHKLLNAMLVYFSELKEAVLQVLGAG